MILDSSTDIFAACSEAHAEHPGEEADGGRGARGEDVSGAVQDHGAGWERHPRGAGQVGPQGGTAFAEGAAGAGVLSGRMRERERKRERAVRRYGLAGTDSPFRTVRALRFFFGDVG